MPDAARLVIVGGSLAGFRGAQAVRDLGFEGELVLVGAEERAPYRRPPLSKELLSGVTGPEGTDLKDDELDATLLLGRDAVRLDLANSSVVLDDGGRQRFDRLLIATGAKPRRLPGTDDLPGVHVLRTLDDALAIVDACASRPRVCVVGGGFIGCEVAASMRERDLPVTLVAPGAQLMPALGRRFAPLVEGLHRDGGVDVRLGRRVSAVEGAGRAERVRLDDDSTIEADLVIVGIGVEPVTGWLQNVGLDTSDGVLCDASLLAVGGGGAIAAAGDLARWPYPRFAEEPLRVEHWTSAVESSQHAARALVRGADEAGAYEPDLYFWSMQHAVHIQSLGMPHLGDEVVIIDGSEEERSFAAIFGRAGIAVGAIAFDRQPAFTNRCRPAVMEHAVLADMR
jgi:NADPH-dependent 2,4-dienoyl-CoA reductase/sulfur reductase-like enzyme